MAKDAKFQIRVSSNVLEKFDSVVGYGNRSRIITNFMKDIAEQKINIKKSENGKDNIYFES